MLSNISKDDIKNYIVIIIIGVVIFGWASYNIYDDYTEVSEKRIILQKEIAAFYKEENKIKEELNNQRNELLLLKRSIENKENTRNNFALKYNNCMTEYKKLKTKINNSEFSSTIENKIIKLMDKFSDLGVNLRKPNWCDKDYTKRYDMASSILKQISSLIGTDSDLRKYNDFVQGNRSFIIHGSRECQKRVIKNM